MHPCSQTLTLFNYIETYMQHHYKSRSTVSSMKWVLQIQYWKHWNYTQILQNLLHNKLTYQLKHDDYRKLCLCHGFILYSQRSQVSCFGREFSRFSSISEILPFLPRLRKSSRLFLKSMSIDNLTHVTKKIYVLNFFLM